MPPTDRGAQGAAVRGEAHAVYRRLREALARASRAMPSGETVRTAMDAGAPER